MAGIPEPAQYLLRIDDLCPTVHHRRWQRLATIIHDFGIQPILAVVPDNQDSELQQSPPDLEFWSKIREMQTGGAAIAIHGYRHQCVQQGKSIIPFHRYTEFAGRPLQEQREMLRLGMEMLRAEGLNPRLWVAPRHGFDRNTLAALLDVGIGYLSDGFAQRPFLRGGVVWIPQQIWAAEPRNKGLWTICLHPNSVTHTHARELRTFLNSFAGQFTSFDRVVSDNHASRLGFTERLYETTAMRRLSLRRSAKRLFRNLQS
jgi:predicted deacetylase